MPGNPLVRFDEGRVGRTLCRPLSYSTVRWIWGPDYWNACLWRSDVRAILDGTREQLPAALIAELF